MDAAALLRLQVEWGADEALDDVPRNRLAPRPSSRIVPPPTPATPAPAPSAAHAASLDTLRITLEKFDGCPLKATATHFVFGEGAATAGLAIVGEAPDRDSDRTGQAFAGPGGAMLDRWLTSIGLDRDAARLLTLVPWRPPGGRAPTDAEAAACLPFLRRHLGLVRPRVLLLLGMLPAKTLLGPEAARRRTAWHKLAVEEVEIQALQIPTPERALRDPAARQAAWAQLIRLRRALDQPSLTPP